MSATRDRSSAKNTSRAVIRSLSAIAESKHMEEKVNLTISQRRSWGRIVWATVLLIAVADVIYREMSRSSACLLSANGQYTRIPSGATSCEINQTRSFIDIIAYLTTIGSLLAGSYKVYKNSSYALFVKESIAAEDIKRMQEVARNVGCEFKETETLSAAVIRMRVVGLRNKETLKDRPAALTFFLGSRSTLRDPNHQIAKYLGCEDLPFKAYDLKNRKGNDQKELSVRRGK